MKVSRIKEILRVIFYYGNENFDAIIVKSGHKPKKRPVRIDSFKIPRFTTSFHHNYMVNSSRYINTLKALGISFSAIVKLLGSRLFLEIFTKLIQLPTDCSTYLNNLSILQVNYFEGENINIAEFFKMVLNSLKHFKESALGLHR